MDDNPRIIDLIKERLAKGEKAYGHGLRHGDDTREWGTREDSWTEMALEEALDMTIYLCTALIRVETERKALEAERARLRAEKNALIMTRQGASKKRSLFRRLMWGDGDGE